MKIFFKMMPAACNLAQMLRNHSNKHDLTSEFLQSLLEPLSASFQKLIGGPIQKSAHISATTIVNELKFGHKIDYNLLQL
jgi:hypothetical protein